MIEKCSNCRYFSKGNLTDSTKVYIAHKCKRFPPIGMKFPTVEESMWCGEFKEDEYKTSLVSE